MQSIIDAGPLGAVDIWGPPSLQADVCFVAFGEIIFLNATTSPRSQQTLPVFYPGDGRTCTYINQPGSVILLPGAPEALAEARSETQSEAQTEAPPDPPKKRGNLVFLIKDDEVSAVALGDCRVRARQNIHVRLAPAGERTGLVIAGRTFTALARTDNWFMVLHDNAERWVSAHFVNMTGPCQPQATSLTGAAPAASPESQSAKMGNLAFLLVEEAVSARPLADCRVRTLQSAHARVKPAGESTALIADDQTLTALAHAGLVPGPD